MAAVTELATAVGTRAACRALFAPRASYYRDRRAVHLPRRDRSAADSGTRSWLRRNAKRSWRICTENASRIARPPLFMRRCSMKASISARSAPCIACSKQQGESRERRDQLTHPPYQKPELLATAPNQLWSWDITKLLGPGQVDLLLPLRDPRCVQPLRHRLDGGACAKAPSWPSG